MPPKAATSLSVAMISGRADTNIAKSSDIDL